jgi:predicted negative regulator of RcsB-dependent stress response
VEVYSNDNDQVDALKTFFAENGKALAVGVVLGIGALVGWRYWTSHQEGNSRQTSQAYESAVSTLKADKPETYGAVENIVANEKNAYGAFAALELAQNFVDANQLDKAEKQLQLGLAAAPDDNLKSVINMRLARVQLQMKQPDAALKTLEGIKGDGWTAIVADLRGEILLSKGDKQGARAAWEAGVKSDASPALSEMMRMKMNNLSI